MECMTDKQMDGFSALYEANHSGDQLIWLGFELDLEIGKLAIPETKLTDTCELLQSLVERLLVPARVWQV